MHDRIHCADVGHDHRQSVYRWPGQVRTGVAGATGRGVRIAVIDSGWDQVISCPQVSTPVGVALRDAPFSSGRSDGWDLIGHGTACADIILRVAPQVDILPIRVFGARLETSVSVLCAAMDLAAKARVDLVNMSLGTRLGHAGNPLSERCEALAAAGTYVVAAAHNTGLDTFPAVFEAAIGVEAGMFASPFELRCHPEQPSRFVAHSEHRRVPWIGGNFANLRASSYAAPMVTGIGALVIERYWPRSFTEFQARLRELAHHPGR